MKWVGALVFSFDLHVVPYRWCVYFILLYVCDLSIPFGVRCPL